MKFILIGFMGSGKSTVGKQLAAQLQLPFTDSYAWIEEQSAISVSRMFELEGESVFRDWEQRFVDQPDETFTKEITARLSSREPIYLQADVVIETDRKTVEEIVNEIAEF